MMNMFSCVRHVYQIRRRHNLEVHYINATWGDNVNEFQTISLEELLDLPC